MKIKLISLILILVLALCGCSHFDLPDTSQYEPFTFQLDSPNTTITINDMPENFYTEFIYNGVKFTINRHGNEILKENQLGDFVYYKKSGENWECCYYDNNAWQKFSYVEDEEAVTAKCLYFIAIKNEAIVNGEKTGKAETICGFYTEEYAFESEDGIASCQYCADNKMVIKSTDSAGTESIIQVWRPEYVEFAISTP